VRSLLFISVWLLLPLYVTAQTLRRPVAAHYTGLGAYSAIHTDVFSFTANQAALAQLKNSAAAVYAERRFLLEELDQYTAAVGFTTPSGNFGLKTQYNGFSGYNESQLGLAYARKLGTKLAIGAQFNYNAVRIAGGYGSASAISIEWGTVLHLTERLHTGFHVNNPFGGKLGINHPDNGQAEKIATVYTFGAGFDASNKFFFGASIEKEEDKPVSVNAGFQYLLIPQIRVRAGMATATSSAWLGIGLTLKSFRLDLTSSYHPHLGISPGLLLLFNLGPRTVSQ